MSATAERVRMNGIPRIPEPREWLLTKVCSQCGERKVWAKFSPLRYNDDGSVKYVSSRCHTCRNAERRASRYDLNWAARNREQRREYHRQYQQQRTAKRRSERTGRDMVPIAPLVAFLRDQVDERGTIAEVAALIGTNEAQIRRVLTEYYPRVSLGKADRYITRLGFHLSDVYPADSLAAPSEAPGREPESSTSDSPVGLLPRKGQR